MRGLWFLAGLLSLSAASGCFPYGGDLSQTYDAVEAIYRSEAKFRTDYAPADAQVDSETVARNFLRIAFQTEEQLVNGEAIVDSEEIVLARWSGDIEYAVYGAYPEDRAHLEVLSDRISSLIGYRIRETEDRDKAQIKLMVISAPERALLMHELAQTADSPLLQFFQVWSQHPSYPCIGSIATHAETGRIDLGVILIKAELSGDFRRACLTEEFVQTLGLVNDDPQVRPSIFNDDQEFIDLTQHDEYLLRILYDNRLRSGMSREEARPLVYTIARELTGDGETVRPQTY